MTRAMATGAAGPAPMPSIHDAAQQAKHLRYALQDDKQRIGCFLGAGCPLGIYDEAGEKSIVLVPAVVQLGDFHYLGLFLEHISIRGERNAG